MKKLEESKPVVSNKTIESVPFLKAWEIQNKEGKTEISGEGNVATRYRQGDIILCEIG